MTRVLEFDAVAGPTSVRCGFDFDREGGGGRLQVVRADGVVNWATIGLILAGIAALIGSVGWFVARLNRSTTT